MKHLRQHQLDDGKQPELRGLDDEAEQKKDDEVAPGIPIVRSNTPRPLSFDAMISTGGQMSHLQAGDSAPLPSFPAKAPSAPPLPEELDEPDNGEDLPFSSPVPLAGGGRSAGEQQDLVWLFEYGLEMDAAILNAPERLDGVAIQYGPAVLKGYRIVFGAQRIHGNSGPTVIAIMPSSDPEAEVWGVLYRVPARMADQQHEPSLLDAIHAAIAPQKFFKGVQVVVHETYQNREITSIAYVATEVARQQLQLVSVEQWEGDQGFTQRLASLARKQKLPDYYVEQYEAGSLPVSMEQPASLPMTNPDLSDLSRGQMVQTLPPPSQLGQIEQDEHNTEPLPAVHNRLVPVADLVPRSVVPPPLQRTNRWLIAFSLYLVSLLLVAFVFAILQGLGFGNNLLTDQFMPLGVPWLVMMYGLLGGCISSIVTLGRFRADSPPAFIIITWFTRPFIGAVLAVMSYLLLTSGIFSFGVAVEHRMAFFLLAGVLAGLGEGGIFFKRG
ncbi:MAG TPA: gamma-glutamylcyclotransferase family protein [Dictyobacter sp.]|jgi:hypothetical protein|nr:gamma-glutamylcyclotransferase family protein [Dictyobacter sp.]